MTKFGEAILPHAGEYAYDVGEKNYKLHDVICYHLFMLLPCRWTMGRKKKGAA